MHEIDDETGDDVLQLRGGRILERIVAVGGAGDGENARDAERHESQDDRERPAYLTQFTKQRAHGYIETKTQCISFRRNDQPSLIVRTAIFS